MAQAILAILLASAMAATFVGRRASNAVSQVDAGSHGSGITDHGECAGGEQAAQIAIALLADPAELVLAPARVPLRPFSPPVFTSGRPRYSYGEVLSRYSDLAGAGIAVARVAM
jgi:hypothetical protein